MFYEVKLKVERENKKGDLKQVTEHFIIEGIDLFCEAEAKAMEIYNGECDVFAINRSKIREIVNQKEEDKSIPVGCFISREFSMAYID